MGRMADAARWYLARGIQPVPLRAKSKLPLHKNWQNRIYTMDEIDTEFPQWCNLGANLGAASNNLIDVDLDHRVAVMFAPYFLPATNARFGRPGKRDSHRVYFVTHDGPLSRRTYTDARDKQMICEIRGTGSQTVLPPSTHADWNGKNIVKTNGEVTWNGNPDEVEIITLPYADIHKPLGYMAAACVVAMDYKEWSGGGILHHAMLALAGALIRNDIPRATVELMCKLIYTYGGEPDPNDRLNAIRDTINKWEADPDTELTGLPTLAGYIGDSHVKKIIDYAGLKNSHRAYELTDDGNAERLIDMYSDRIRYNKTTGHWYQWEGTRWEKDITPHGDSVLHLARSIPRKLTEEATATTDDKEMAALAKWSIQSQNVNRLLAIPRIARSLPEIVISTTDLDKAPMLFNVQNGVINLRTGGLEPHDSNELISKISPIAYNERATCPQWLDFLALAMEGRQELIDYLHVYLGYCLTGWTTEQIFTVFYGPKGTGKSTFVQTLLHIFGEYATTAEPKSFMVKSFESRASSDIARLAGYRLVITSEAEQNHRFASALVKRLTGSTTITAAPLYQDEFSYRPTFKLAMDTNFRPRVAADDDAIWDRLVTIPFDHTFRGTEAEIKGYEYKLRPESSGILAWLVEGCLKYQADGLIRPDILTNSKQEYRDEVDTVAQFLNDRTFRTPDARTSARDLHIAYVAWCKLNDESHFAVQRFSNRLRTIGYETVNHRGRTMFKDISLWKEGNSYDKDDDDAPIFTTGKGPETGKKPVA